MFIEEAFRLISNHAKEERIVHVHVHEFLQARKAVWLMKEGPAIFLEGRLDCAPFLLTIAQVIHELPTDELHAIGNTRNKNRPECGWEVCYVTS